MKRTFLVGLAPVFLLAALVGATPAHAGGRLGGTVIIHKVRPRPGLIRVCTEHTEMRFKISAQGQTISMQTSERERKSEKLLAARGSTPLKLQVTYHQAEKTEVRQGRRRLKPVPIAGKTYVVEARGGRVVVTTRGGKPVPANEERLVIKDHRSLGKPDRMFDSTPAGPIRIGDRVPAMERAMKRSFTEEMAGNPREQWTISSPTVRLTGTGRVDGARVAIFSLRVSMTLSQAGGFSMTMHMAGTVSLRLSDAWPLRMTMSGPMDIMGQKNAGRMTMSQRYQYR